MGLTLRVHIGDVVGPTHVLLNLGLTTGIVAQAIFGGELSQRGELLLYGRQIVFLERDDVFPTVLVAASKGGTARKQAIQQKADRQTGKAVLEAGGQAIEGFEFAILFGRVFARVLDELGHQRENKAARGYQLGFQDRMIVDRLAVVRAGQALGAVPLGEDQHARAIHDDQEVTVQQPVGIQHFATDQRVHGVSDDHLEFRRIQPAERGI